MSATIDAYQRGFTFLRDPRFVSIAAVQGYAIGAGFQLALSCDLRVVTEDAQFCMKESALGLVPDLTGTKPLVECVGYARALEICATARMVGAAEAVDIGLALAAVPADRAGRDGRGPRRGPDRADRRRGPRDQGAAPGRRRSAAWTSSAASSARRRPAGSGSSPALMGGRTPPEQGAAMSGMGMGPAWRHLRSDRSAVNSRHRARGTVRRVLGFARPHRPPDRVFLVLTVIDAGLVVVTPLLVQRIVDDGIRGGDSRPGHRAGAGDGRGRDPSAASSRSLTGWLSSRIGEGLIYDLRTRVFGHVQRQSLAFFTRTQTGALVSRLNNDVIGAQRAFTSTLSSTVSNTISVVVVGVAMLALSWQVTLLCLVAVSRCCYLSSRGSAAGWPD